MQMIEWTKETKKIKELKFYEKNPRKLAKVQAKHLRDSLEKFGQCEPIVVNADGTIIGGHQRVRTLKKMGKKEVDVYMPTRDLEPKEVEELNIRLNRVHGDFDYDVLANSWDVLDLLEWGFEQNDFDLDGSLDLIDEKEEEETHPEPPKTPQTKPGDIYQLNDHRLICGDSTCPETVEKLLGGSKPILMVTDPPYGVDYDAYWREKAQKPCVSKGKVSNDCRVDWSEAWKLFPGSVSYVWCASWFLPEVAHSLEKNDFDKKSLIIWVKQVFALSRGDYHWKHESCWYAVKKGHKHNWQGSRKETTVWEIDSLHKLGRKKESYENNESTGHSTQKPIECMARPIRNNSAKGESVYDPFLGSGTTLIAAEKLGRTCYGIEIDPGYCDVIVDRWKNYMQKNQRLGTIKKNGKVINETS